jgi:hypothetical protein
VLQEKQLQIESLMDNAEIGRMICDKTVQISTSMWQGAEH